MEQLFSTRLTSIEEKEAFLHAEHIALWDSIGSCSIRGSADSAIENAVPNDIKGLVGPRGNEYYIGLPDDLDREKLENLLSSRRHCLGMLFRKDPEGVKHFRKINRYLKDLTDRMYKRAAKIYRQYLSAGMDDGFDDDFMIDADLRFYYGGEEPIAILGDEEYYGSDFEYMLDVICEFCDKSPTCGASFTKSLRKTDRVEMSDKELDLYNSDDEMDWGELKI